MIPSDYQRIAIALAMVKPDHKPGRWEYATEMHQWRIDVNAITDALAFYSSGFSRADFLAECDYHE